MLYKLEYFNNFISKITTYELINYFKKLKKRQKAS